MKYDITPRRIAEIIDAHWVCDCGEWTENLEEQFRHVAERIFDELQLGWLQGELEATKTLLEETQKGHKETIRDFCTLRDALPRSRVAELLGIKYP